MQNKEQTHTNFSHPGVPKDAISRANKVLSGVNSLRETGKALDAEREVTAARLERDDARDKARLEAEQHLGATSLEHAGATAIGQAPSNVAEMPAPAQLPAQNQAEQARAA